MTITKTIAAAAKATSKSMPRTLHKFPWNVNLGTDICHVARIHKILQSARMGPRFIRRILTPDERFHPKVRPLLLGTSSIIPLGSANAGSVISSLGRGKEGEGQRWQDTMRRKVIDEGDDDGDVEVKEYEEEQGVERISRDADGQGEGEGEKQNATSGEQAASVSPRDLQVAATFMAGRFAAKEAVIKAHPHRALTWQDITIRRGRSSAAAVHPNRDGAPVAIIRGEGDEDYEALISISHDGEYATAVCLGAGVD